MPSATQTNVMAGDYPVTAGETLTSMEARLAKIDNSSGSAVAKLPAATTDDVTAVITEGAASGSEVLLRPLKPDQQARVILKGTCDSGDRLCMADPSTEADKGKVRTVPASAGTYIVVAIAEESGVDGQHVKLRPYGPLSVTVSE